MAARLGKPHFLHCRRSSSKSRKDEIQKDAPGITKKKFLYNLSRASYEKQWGKNYQRPTFGEKFLAFLYKPIPKLGPLRVLQFRTPTPQTENMFEESCNATLDRYRPLLSGEAAGRVELINENYDPGGMAGPGKYCMNDEAHAKLLGMLAKQKFAGASPGVREEFLGTQAGMALQTWIGAGREQPVRAPHELAAC